LLKKSRDAARAHSFCQVIEKSFGDEIALLIPLLATSPSIISAQQEFFYLLFIYLIISPRRNASRQYFIAYIAALFSFENLRQKLKERIYSFQIYQ